MVKLYDNQRYNEYWQCSTSKYCSILPFLFVVTHLTPWMFSYLDIIKLWFWHCQSYLELMLHFPAIKCTWLWFWSIHQIIRKQNTDSCIQKWKRWSKMGGGSMTRYVKSRLQFWVTPTFNSRMPFCFDNYLL